MASPHLPQWPPSSSLPPASSTISLATNECVYTCLGSQSLLVDRGTKVIGLEACRNLELLERVGAEKSWRTMGETELPHAQVPQKQGENPGPSS